MRGNQAIYRRYAEAIGDDVYSRGYALLHPSPVSLLHPVVYGYFDKGGNWRPIVDVSKIGSDRQENFMPLELQLKPLENISTLYPSPLLKWEPVCSVNVICQRVVPKVGLDPLE